MRNVQSMATNLKATASPLRVAGLRTTADTRPLYDPQGSATVTVGPQAEEPVPWLLYGGIAAAVAAVAYVVYVKKFK